MVCLKGQPDMFRQLRGKLYRVPVASMVADVLKGQSQSHARQICSATIPCMMAEERCALVVKLCEDDEFQLILLLDESYEIMAAGVGHEEARVMLGHACRNGNLDLVVWLANQFEFQTQDILARLDIVCARGHAHIMRWLTDRFRLTAAHIRARSVLLHACRSGDLDFVRWVVERFGLTARDARKGHNRLLWCLRSFRLEQVTALIVTHFGLGRPGSCLSLAVMIRYGGPYIAIDEHCLRAIWWLEKTQAVRLGPRACHHFMQYAVGNKYLNVIQWIVHRYGFTQKDLTIPMWSDRQWLDSVRDTVWTEVDEVVAVQ